MFDCKFWDKTSRQDKDLKYPDVTHDPTPKHTNKQTNTQFMKGTAKAIHHFLLIQPSGTQLHKHWKGQWGISHSVHPALNRSIIFKNPHLFKTIIVLPQKTKSRFGLRTSERGGGALSKPHHTARFTQREKGDSAPQTSGIKEEKSFKGTSKQQEAKSWAMKWEGGREEFWEISCDLNLRCSIWLHEMSAPPFQNAFRVIFSPHLLTIHVALSRVTFTAQECTLVMPVAIWRLWNFWNLNIWGKVC